MARDSLATRLQESVGVFHALGPKSPAPAGQCALRRPASTAASRRPHQTTRLPGRRLEASVIGQDSGESWAPGAGAPKLGGGAQDPLPSWSRTGEDSSSGCGPNGRGRSGHPCPPSAPRDICWDVCPGGAPFDPFHSGAALPVCGASSAPEKPSREGALPGSSSRRFEWLGPDTRPVDVEMVLAEFRIPPLLSPLREDDTPEGPTTPKPPRAARGGKAVGAANPGMAAAGSLAGSSGPERAVAARQPGWGSVDHTTTPKESRTLRLHLAQTEDAGPASEVHGQSLVVDAPRQGSGRPSAPEARARRPPWTRDEEDSSGDEGPGGPSKAKATRAVPGGKARGTSIPGQGAAGALAGSTGPERPVSASVDQAHGLEEGRNAPLRPAPRGGSGPQCPRPLDGKPTADAHGGQAQATDERRTSARNKRDRRIGQAQPSPPRSTGDTKGPLQSEAEGPGREARGRPSREIRPKRGWDGSQVRAPRDDKVDGRSPSPSPAAANEQPPWDTPWEEPGKWSRPSRKRSRSQEEVSLPPGKRTRGPLDASLQRSLEVSPAVAPTGLSSWDLAALSGGRLGSGSARLPVQATRLQLRSSQAAAPGKDSGQPSAPDDRVQKPVGRAEGHRSPPTRTSAHSRLAPCPWPDPGRPPLRPAAQSPPQPPAGPPLATPAPVPGPSSAAQPRLQPTPQLPLRSLRPGAAPPIDFSSQPLPWRMPTVPGPVRSLPIPKDLRSVREAMKRRAQRAREIPCPPSPPRDIWDVCTRRASEQPFP
ncbi:collagen alpha-1(I) chain-like [Ornithorhynchus anatinus]|uniref:collagen alpha-1(I) chain-like n=1 Tax=Ornithorhynchus anatinus TaxID=9258 RepID=UPI0019D48B74|nr:collagen alpha-1(I) chain-like [Ornithorhynchus anatinus]